MYRISVPIMNGTLKRSGRDRILAELRRLDASRVFLALDRYETDPDRRRAVLRKLADNCRFFKAQGYEVGAWIWTFWIKDNREFRNMRAISGKEIVEFMCPSDERFVAFAADYAADIARCGVDLIQYDDDFRYGFLSSTPACLCDGHIEAINRITGEEKTREELERYVTSGGKNKFRDAYLKANGDAFRHFAASVRAAVDAIDPSIRMGACTCMTSWDVDGTDAAELARILAGKTRPFARLIGAPYWAARRSWGNELQDVIELERMESAWTRDGEIELMAEGDVYPRPRTRCPASYLEGFDTAIRASGCTDGILKYGLDYCSNADYETGYATLHGRNRELYAAIDRLFGGKRSCGVRVYESMKKLADAVAPTAVNEAFDPQEFFFSNAARTLAYNTVPTVYEGEGVAGIVFDENARDLPLDALGKGLILDLAAAEILTERGVDVGLERIGRATCGETEHFLNSNNHILMDKATVYELALRDGVEILSDVETPLGTLPVSYRYENADGDRFLVLNLNTRSKHNNPLRHYARSRQYADLIPWLSGERLPAYVYGNPALYIQCKRNECGMAVGLWNFFADPTLFTTVELDRKYRSVEFVNCSGRLEGNRVILSEIPPFGFAAFEVRY